MIIVCIGLGLIIGAIGAVSMIVILFLIQRRLMYKNPKLPKWELSSLGGIPVFVGGIGWSRPILMPVTDPWCNQAYFGLAALLLLGLSARPIIRLIIWCGHNSPRR